MSVLVALLGMARRRPTPLLVAAVLVGPASAYLAATARFRVWGLVPVGIYLLSAVAIRRIQRVLAAALVGANTAFIGWLTVMLFG